MEMKARKIFFCKGTLAVWPTADRLCRDFQTCNYGGQATTKTGNYGGLTVRWFFLPGTSGSDPSSCWDIFSVRRYADAPVHRYQPVLPVLRRYARWYQPVPPVRISGTKGIQPSEWHTTSFENKYNLLSYRICVNLLLLFMVIKIIRSDYMTPTLHFREYHLSIVLFFTHSRHRQQQTAAQNTTQQ